LTLDIRIRTFNLKKRLDAWLWIAYKLVKVWMDFVLILTNAFPESPGQQLISSLLTICPGRHIRVSDLIFTLTFLDGLIIYHADDFGFLKKAWFNISFWSISFCILLTWIFFGSCFQIIKGIGTRGLWWDRDCWAETEGELLIHIALVCLSQTAILVAQPHP